MSIRVHELAKELNLSSKEVMSRLKTIGVDVKNHLSTVENAEANQLRTQKPQSKEQVSDSGKSAPAQEKSSPVQGSEEGDRGNSSQVASSQAPRTEGRPQGQRPAGMEGRPQGQRPAGMEGRPQGQRPAGMEGRPQGQRPAGMEGRPQGQRPAGMEGRPQGQRPAGMEGRPQGQRPPGMEGRPQGQRPPGMEGRPQGQRPPGMEGRPQGQRPPGMQGRPQGQRPPGMEGRPQGQRPPGMEGRPQGQRPPGMQGRPQGQRPAGMDGRPQGQRPPGMQGHPQGQRPGMDGRPQGQRPPQRPPATPSAPAVEQPPKRQIGDKKKPQDRSFERKKEMEKEMRSPRNNKRHMKHAPREVRDTAPKHIVIPGSITVQELASRMSRKSGEVIKKLMDMGVMATINQEIDSETATIIAGEMGVTVEVKVEKPISVIEEIVDDEADLSPRPPVVTVMGHVDHGKTSLLDAIRAANVTASEAGGITQHIGAYQVEIKGQKITFLDTPGHEAFTAMRARGAQVTDIAILVVAADDGVMPQTIEAINHAKAADVPIIVAINKIDKEDANSDRVKQELTEYGLVVEEWGGDTIAVPVSAKARTNIEQLLEMILLVAEVKELKANPNRIATGTVIEAELDKGKGPVATMLVAKGTLNVGDMILAGSTFGRIRAMVDDKGRRVKKAGPSTPVEVQGLNEVPVAGQVFHVVEDEKHARQIAEARANERKAEEVQQISKVSLEDLFDRIKEGEVKELNVIIKADVQGSIEALKQSLLRLSTSEVRVNPIHGGVGAITETDIMLAAASNAIIIGFNVRPDANTKATAELQGVDMRLYRVIYDAIEDVKAAMTGMLDPDFKEVVQGRAEVRQVFKVPKVGAVAGSYVLNGKITRHSKVRVIRDSIVIHEGELESLRRFKDDAKEVMEGYECGIGVANFNDIKEGDIIEAFIMEEVKRQL
ncbi:bacterial translation initiation factor 2 (bIF-2) [Desulfitobacterium dichloroeliminans LMG P-21439]|uniref:Translation initiation factor IF-2 n=1 Tax=Desulfitobacterium dichloroeliminans (strain LMG P-21439 / DCA1) TaxID=871963 RepID=L0FBH9_DESDL|nr:translation initiation factor IF-2 [Desulfitobacterium dichloroeliminans]AGA69996.1 bacterial translation initiation factor 2 (bIF-2) [Desulfitobacterium dichloroeliminans LMG P-21439]